jgi:hypothetical protein
MAEVKSVIDEAVVNFIMWALAIMIFVGSEGTRIYGFPNAFFNAVSSGEQYFPPQTCHADYYSKYLKALREPSLWEVSKSSEHEVYRFLWLRSFHAPVVVRLNVDAAAGILTTKISNGKGGYEPGKIVVNRVKRMSSRETQWFLARIEELDYWDLSSEEAEDANTIGLDGAQWILEATKGGNYKIVHRWSPEKGPIRVLGLMMLLDLSKLKLLFQDVY